MSKATGTAIVEAEKAKGATGVAVYDYGEDAGAGFEGTTQADYKPSFLRVLQGLSPQIETVPGAKPGLLIDTVTNELFDTFDFIPCVYEHVYVAWKPRGVTGGGGDGGQGFGGVYQREDAMVVKAVGAVPKFSRGQDGKIVLPVTPDGQYNLVETIYFHGLQVANETAFPASIPFSSTSLNVGSAWLTTARKQIIPGATKSRPIWSHVYNVGTAPRSNAAGKWYVPTVSFRDGSATDARLDPQSDLYKAGKSVMEQFKAGRVNVDYSKAGAADSAPGGATVKDEEIPF